MASVALKISDGSEMNAYTARPRAAPQKGIIVLQEAFGVNDYMRRTTDSLAQKGFLAIAPELFHRSAPSGFEASYTDYASVAPHMQALTDEGMSADIKASYDWLVEQGTPKDKVAAIGFCMGGRAAFLANTILPLAAAVSFYGGRTSSLVDRVGDISGPMLFFWGQLDTHLTPEERIAVMSAMTKAGKPFEYKIFPEAGHAFARDVGESYHKPSADEAWSLTDTFLAKYL